MNDIYKDIALRTGGDIQIGVVGPVRTGKSAFITKFMELLVIPNIAGKNKKQIAVDELPQSAKGQTVMTTEPKFVPGEAVNVKLDKAQARIRLIDCVGYMVDGAMGHEENGEPRLVKTPWSEEEMPFGSASEYGTQKVISEHSTVGIVITADGSFTELKREAYLKAEERVVKELKSLNKPFIVLFNTVDPQKKEVGETCRELEKRYEVPVMPINVTALKKEDVTAVFEKLLFEFPLRVLNVRLPEWVRALPKDNAIVSKVMTAVGALAAREEKMSAFKSVSGVFNEDDGFTKATDVTFDMGEGSATLTFEAKPDLFYNVITEECGEKIDGEYELIKYVRELKTAKDGYDKISAALEAAETTGYGIVEARCEEAEVGEPHVVKKNGQYCVRMRVGAKSMHVIRADVHDDIEIVSGTKSQCDGFAEGLNAKDGAGLDTKVFGRPVRSMIEEKLGYKCTALNDNVKLKLKRTVNKAVNEKKTNLICILI